MISMVASMRTHYGAVQRVYGRTFPLSEETLCWFASFDGWETLRLFRADFLYAGLGLLAGP